MKDNIKNEITFKFLEEKELPGISRLIQSMKKSSDEVLYLRDNSVDYYNWMYFKNPAGNAIIASAWHNDKLVSTFAMAPKNAIINSRPTAIGKTMDMFTDPDYQGLGIMSKLTNMVFEESVKKGLLGWYVTPSGNSYPIFKSKWKYQEPFHISFKYRIINIKKMSETIALSTYKKIFLKIAAALSNQFFKPKKSSSKNYAISNIDSITDEFDLLWESVKSDYENALTRDSSYLNWRFILNPDTYKIYTARNSDNTLSGYIVTKKTLRKGVPTGEIVDFLFSRENEEAGLSLLGYAQQKLYEEGCALCEAWDFEDSIMTNILYKSGLKKNRAIVKFLFSPDCSVPEFYEGSRWLLTQADGNDI